jgi:hypothetical protein
MAGAQTAKTKNEARKAIASSGRATRSSTFLRHRDVS